MSKRSAGVVLLGISAFLYSMRTLAAALFSSGVQSWNADLFRSMISYIDHQGVMLNASIIALVAGIFYLFWAEISALRK